MRTYAGLTVDKNLLLKDAGLVGASAAAQVGGSNQILNLGLGRFEGYVVIDWTACEVATGDESYRIEIQFSDSATFASNIWIGAVVHLGDSTVSFESADTVAAGRRVVPFTNEIQDVQYPYMRLYTRVAGTVATGINYSARVAKL
jgi:hypothetical protein